MDKKRPVLPPMLPEQQVTTFKLPTDDLPEIQTSATFHNANNNRITSDREIGYMGFKDLQNRQSSKTYHEGGQQTDRSRVAENFYLKLYKKEYAEYMRICQVHFLRHAQQRHEDYLASRKSDYEKRR
jgi:hypothetical protein